MIQRDTIKLLRECDAGVRMGMASIADVEGRVHACTLEVTGRYDRPSPACALRGSAIKLRHRMERGAVIKRETEPPQFIERRKPYMTQKRGKPARCNRLAPLGLTIKRF